MPAPLPALPPQLALRFSIEDAGADCITYHEDGCSFHIKRGCLVAVLAVAAAGGLTLGKGPYDLCTFPLGSDNPPEEWRHESGPYNAANGHKPGFWLCARFYGPRPY